MCVRLDWHWLEVNNSEYCIFVKTVVVLLSQLCEICQTSNYIHIIQTFDSALDVMPLKQVRGSWSVDY